MGSDISEVAIENAKINLNKYEAQAEVYVSNVLDQIPADKKFDLIYWNYPFHYSEDKDYDSMNLIEKTCRDPNYKHLEKLLSEAKKRFNNGKGRIIITFAFNFGNFEKLK